MSGEASGALPTPLVEALQGRYRVERQVGEGGMSTVYLAHDQRHDRRVALKVLRPELAALVGAERFLAEIRTTANLQHPHILPLFDSGEVDGLVFYVMPFVEGESLRQRLVREKQLGVDEALRIAREVASALDYAHRRGVIHRDIKPENILLHDGQALVADFGIALAASNAGGTRMTETGMSLGTPHYMSPEQALGEREITARSDVYALGCVLYEMLIGEPPFTAPTAQAIVGKMLSSEPGSIVARRRTVPVHVEAAVLAALEKLPADRFPTAAAFAAALDGSSAPVGRTAAPQSVSFPAAGRLRAWLPWLIAGVGLVVGGVGISSAFARGFGQSPVTQWYVALDSAPLAFIGNATLGLGHPALTLSPDGDALVYAGTFGSTTRLYSHRVGSFEIVPLPGTEGAFSPFFKPDGQRVGFFAGNELKSVALNGGSAVVLAEVVEPYGGAWLANGLIVVGDQQGAQLSKVSETGGQLVSLGVDGQLPGALPDADLVLHQSNVMPAIIAVTSTETGQRRYLTRGGPVDSLPGAEGLLLGERPVYLPSGHLLFFSPSENALLAVSFDAETLRIAGEPVRVLDGVRRETMGGQVAASGGGSIAYAAGDNAEAGRLVWASAGGALDTLPLPADVFGQPSLSPDGTRLVIPATTPTGLNELRHYQLDDLVRGVIERWTNPAPFAMSAVWHASGSWLAVRLWPYDTFRFSVALSLGDTLVKGMWVDDFTPDGSTAIGRILDEGGQTDLATVALDSSRAAPTVAPRPGDQFFPQISPSGRWIAYMSSEIGSWEVFIEPFPLTGARRKVSLAGGEEPRWSPEGNKLYYRSRDTFYAVPFDARAGVAGIPEPFISGSFVNVPGFSYDVGRDGRLLLIHGHAQQTANHIRFISDFAEQVSRMRTR